MRAVNVAAASGADMVVNFPLWIAAKRLSAGLPLPRLGEIYKGSGALYLAFFPMMVVEDWATGVVDRTLGGRLGDESRHLVSACASGPAAAVLVGSQVEGLITRAHGVCRAWRLLMPMVPVAEPCAEFACLWTGRRPSHEPFVCTFASACEK